MIIPLIFSGTKIRTKACNSGKLSRQLYLLVGLVVLGVALTGLEPVSSTVAARGKGLEVEVAENGWRFSPDETPVHEDSRLPAYGGEFITEGYIYPKGTVSCEDNLCDGVFEDGKPEFPDLVIGKWTCRGWHVGDGAHTVSGPWVVTTQIFDLGDMPGAKTIVTDGYEFSDFNVEFLRAITGGTGKYSKARGQQKQGFLGWNASIGRTQRMVLELKK